MPEIKPKDKILCLYQKQMAELFDATKQNISLHIQHIFEKQELLQSCEQKE